MSGYPACCARAYAEREAHYRGRYEWLRLRRRLETPPATLVEIGTGTGCIGISLLAGWTGARGVGYDRNPAAIELTRENAVRHGVEDRLELSAEDGFDTELPACQDSPSCRMTPPRDRMSSMLEPTEMSRLSMNSSMVSHV